MHNDLCVIININNNQNINKCINSVLENSVKPNKILVLSDNNKSTNKELANLFNIKETIDQEWIQFIYENIDIIIVNKKFITNSEKLNYAMCLSQDCEIIGLIQSDCWCEKDYIKDNKNIFEKYNRVVITISDCVEFTKNGLQVIECKPPFSVKGLIKDYKYDNNFFFKNKTPNNNVFNTFLQKCEDYEFMLRIARTGLIYHIPKVLYYKPMVVKTKEIMDIENIIRQKTIEEEKQYKK